MKKILTILFTTLTIVAFTYIVCILTVPEYRGIQIKVSRNIASFMTWQGMIGLIITLYVISVVKEFMNHKLWLHYEHGLWRAIKTTLLLLISPFLTISVIETYYQKE